MDTFEIHGKNFEPQIPHKTGFGLSLLKGNKAHIHSYSTDLSEVFHCLSGEWEITCDDEKVVIGSCDTFSVPKKSLRSVKHISKDEGSVFIIRQKN